MRESYRQIYTTTKCSDRPQELSCFILKELEIIGRISKNNDERENRSHLADDLFNVIREELTQNKLQQNSQEFSI